MLLPIPIAAIVLILLYAPLVAGVIYASNRHLQGARLKVADVLRGAVKYWAPAMVFALLCAVFMVILISSWWYYGNRSGMFYFALAVFQTYFVAMFFVSQMYTLTLVVQQELGIFRAIGRSVKMFIKHPAYTIGAFFQSLSVAVLLLLTVIGFLFLYVGIMGIYLNRITRNLLPEEDNEEAEGKKPITDTWGLSDNNERMLNRGVQYES
ncbi:hypothetical protein D3C73_1014240 [compost metagenome]